MIEVNELNAVQYLKGAGRIPLDASATASLLGWGVSNVVVRVNVVGGADLIVKQSREQLRTKTDWFSRLDRIYREADALQLLGNLLPKGSVPQILFEDRDEFLFAMEALPANHRVWKAELLEGRAVDVSIAKSLGQMLATAHKRTTNDARVKELFGDRTVFRQLRIDPFYRHIARVHPDLEAPLAPLIANGNDDGICLVLGDFSPKNILLVDGPNRHPADQSEQVDSNRTVLVDFETAHFGDPAFDLGFFLSHLLLKTILNTRQTGMFRQLIETFWREYLSGLGTSLRLRAVERPSFDQRIAMHLCACMLSRIDGTSTVDYLTRTEDVSLVRRYCRRELLAETTPQDSSLEDLFDRFFGELIQS